MEKIAQGIEKLPKILKNCPNGAKSPHLVTLDCAEILIVQDFINDCSKWEQIIHQLS